MGSKDAGKGVSEREDEGGSDRVDGLVKTKM